MHMNRRRPEKGEDPANFLSGVVWDAIRDAREAGLEETEIHIMLSVIARRCDPMGHNRVWARTPTRDELLELVKLDGSIGWDAALAIQYRSENIHVEMHRRSAEQRCAEYLARTRLIEHRPTDDAKPEPPTTCQAARDGECFHKLCPGRGRPGWERIECTLPDRAEDNG